MYYLAGYVVKKASKFSECVECRATITDTQSVPAASVLTEARSFVPGALKHPSKSLTELLGAVESVVEAETKTQKVFGNLFWKTVDVISGLRLARVRCNVHYEGFTV